MVRYDRINSTILLVRILSLEPVPRGLFRYSILFRRCAIYNSSVFPGGGSHLHLEIDQRVSDYQRKSLSSRKNNFLRIGNLRNVLCGALLSGADYSFRLYNIPFPSDLVCICLCGLLLSGTPIAKSRELIYCSLNYPTSVLTLVIRFILD